MPDEEAVGRSDRRVAVARVIASGISSAGRFDKKRTPLEFASPSPGGGGTFS